MCLSCKESTRSFDMFGVPIGVTYKKEYNFKTVFGGIITILLVILFGGQIIESLVSVLFTITYSKKVTTNFFNYEGNNESWSLSTKNQTIAGFTNFLDGNTESLNVDDYVRIMFYSVDMVNGE